MEYRWESSHPSGRGRWRGKKPRQGGPRHCAEGSPGARGSVLERLSGGTGLRYRNSYFPPGRRKRREEQACCFRRSYFNCRARGLAGCQVPWRGPQMVPRGRYQGVLKGASACPRVPGEHCGMRRAWPQGLACGGGSSHASWHGTARLCGKGEAQGVAEEVRGGGAKPERSTRRRPSSCLGGRSSSSAPRQDFCPAVEVAEPCSPTAGRRARQHSSFSGTAESSGSRIKSPGLV